MELSVQPKSEVIEKVIAKMNINISSLTLGKECSFSVTLLTENSDFVKHELVYLRGDDYANWGNDDAYIVNFFLSRYGLTQVQIV